MVRKTLTQKPNFNGRIPVQIILTIQFFCCDNRCSLKRIRNQTLFRCGITLLWLESNSFSTKKRGCKKHQKLSSVLQKQWTKLKVWCEQTEKRNTNTTEIENSRKRPLMWDPKAGRGPNETRIKNRDYWNKQRQKRRGGRRRVAHTRRRVVWNLAARGGCSSRKYLDDGRSEVSGQDDSARVTVGDDSKSTDGGSKTKNSGVTAREK